MGWCRSVKGTAGSNVTELATAPHHSWLCQGSTLSLVNATAVRELMIKVSIARSRFFCVSGPSVCKCRTAKNVGTNLRSNAKRFSSAGMLPGRSLFCSAHTQVGERMYRWKFMWKEVGWFHRFPHRYFFGIWFVFVSVGFTNIGLHFCFPRKCKPLTLLWLRNMRTFFGLTISEPQEGFFLVSKCANLFGAPFAKLSRTHTAN